MLAGHCYLVREQRQPLRLRKLQQLLADGAMPLGGVARSEEGTAQAAEQRGHLDPARVRGRRAEFRWPE